MGRHFICVFSFLLLFAGAAQAQMSSKWVKQEKGIWPLVKKACKDERAFKQLKDEAWMGDSTASYWVYRTMTDKRCVHYTRTRRHWDSYLRKAAQAKFPRAMSDYGKNLMYGYGLTRDVKRGVSYLESAVKAGSAAAAGELAYAYGKGNVLPYNPGLALKYLDRSVKAGLRDADIRIIHGAVRRELRREVEKTAMNARKATGKAAPVLEKPSQTAAQSGAVAQTSKTTAPSQSSGGSQPPAYAVLAVSQPDAAFGFAHDYTNRDEAQKRALNECRKRNGKDCDIKLVLRGGGCVAYRYKPGESVYGWGVSRARDAAQDRAADECRKRNGSQQCDAHAWVCNSTTKAKLAIELEKDMPPVRQAAGQPCYVVFAQACSNFANHLNQKGKPWALMSIYSYTAKPFYFPNCGEENANSVGWDWTRNNWTKYSTDRGVPDSVKQKMKTILTAFRDAVFRKFPKCGKPKRFSSTSTVIFHSTKKSFENAKAFAEKIESNRFIDFQY